MALDPRPPSRAPLDFGHPPEIDSMDVSDDFKPKKKFFFFWYKKFFFGLFRKVQTSKKSKIFENFQKSKIFIIGVRALIFGPSR